MPHLGYSLREVSPKAVANGIGDGTMTTNNVGELTALGVGTDDLL